MLKTIAIYIRRISTSDPLCITFRETTKEVHMGLKFYAKRVTVHILFFAECVM